MIVPGLKAAARGVDWVRQRMESGTTSVRARPAIIT